MSNPIIKYKLFKSSEDFEKWQVEKGSSMNITSVLPYNFGMDIDIKEDSNMNGSIGVGVFVVYWEV